jgi:iron complex transport system substrate-binding protein
MADTVGVTDARKQAVVAMWGRMSVLKAVREKRIYAVAADYFVVPGPRMVEAARAFARMLHPEAGF